MVLALYRLRLCLIFCRQALLPEVVISVGGVVVRIPEAWVASVEQGFPGRQGAQVKIQRFLILSQRAASFGDVVL